MRMVVDVARSAPMWVWVAWATAVASVGLLVAAVLRASARAERWRDAARKARSQARLWQIVAEGRARSVLDGKRTVVAPQYHAPRS